MKRRILILLLTLFCTVTYAQKKDYTFIINSIDKWVNVYSGKEYLTIEIPSEKYWEFYNLSEPEQNKVIDHVLLLYNNKASRNLYRLAEDLLITFFDRKNISITVQNRIIEAYLDNVYYTVIGSISTIGNIANYSEKAKLRLQNILEGQKTEKDIEARKNMILGSTSSTVYSRERETKAKKIMRETNRKGRKIESYLIDSLINVYVEEQIQFYEQYPPVEKFTILQIGSSNDKRFISGLETVLETVLETDYISFRPNTNISSLKSQISSVKQACTYALAKLGVQKYLDEIYNSNYVPYRYLGTQEAFLKQLDKEFVWNKGGSIFTHRKARPMALVALEDAMIFGYGYLENIPKEIEKEVYSLYDFVIPEDIGNYDPNTDEQNREVIEKAYRLYNWLKENQDVWQMPPAQDTF